MLNYGSVSIDSPPDESPPLSFGEHTTSICGDDCDPPSMDYVARCEAEKG